jgi:hypothetical protein
MMTSTARLQIPELAGSENVANGPTRINEGWSKVDNTNLGHQDFLQAGVIASTDWSFTANINSGTGALGSTGTTGGTAWLPDPVVSGALMRSVTTPATLSGLAPTTKPASGKYMTIGYELAPASWGTAATVSVVSGTEVVTEAEALESSPAITAGRIRLRDVVVHNSSGTYSIVHERDRRPWARGFYYTSLLSPNKETTGGALAVISASELGFRAECRSGLVRIRGWGSFRCSSAEVECELGIFLDGSALNYGAIYEPRFSSAHRAFTMLADLPLSVTGSRLLQLAWRVSGGATLTALGETGSSAGVFFSVEEIMRQNTNNGTS